ncbi:hypothetical protein RUND412_010825 [Rhizina undulata]
MLFRFASSLTAAVALFASVNASPSPKQWSTKGNSVVTPATFRGFSFILLHSGTELHFTNPRIDTLDRKVYVSVNLPPSANLVGDLAPVPEIPYPTSGFTLYNPIPAPGHAIPWLTIKEGGHLEYDFNQFTPIKGDFIRWRFDEDGLYLTYDGFEGGYACKVGDGIWLLYFAVRGRPSACPLGQEGLGVRWRAVPANNDELR